jgi:hypothetical protein
VLRSLGGGEAQGAGGAAPEPAPAPPPEAAPPVSVPGGRAMVDRVAFAVEVPSVAAASAATPAPASGAAATPLDATSVRRAWRALLEGDDDHIAGGLRILLRGAPVDLGEAGEVTVGLAPGSPAYERLQATAARRNLEAALARRLRAPVTLRIVAAEPGVGGGDGGTRITAETARQERLRHLTEEEPLLARAVQEWDLELVE